MNTRIHLWFGAVIGAAMLAFACGGHDDWSGKGRRTRPWSQAEREAPRAVASPPAAPAQRPLGEVALVRERAVPTSAVAAPTAQASEEGLALDSRPRKARAAADPLAVRQPVHQPAPMYNTEQYDHVPETDFSVVADAPLSTFSVDVDTASYSNMRRFLMRGSLPPADAVRVEELINYFDYDYGHPEGEHPIAIATEVAACPWNPDHVLVRVGLRAHDPARTNPPHKNLVFLVDVSGSMEPPDKLPLLKRALTMLTSQLGERDRVAIVVYAGASGVVLPATPGNDRAAVTGALDRLSAGGSTNGGAGLELAYRIAEQHRQPGAINRVILATDGDFNVGDTSRGQLTRLIEDKRDRGIFLTVLGFGMYNLKDATMEMLADKGNGNYAYIDTDREAQKVLVEEIGSTLKTVAKDVKIQVEMNPALVAEYRLLGYENRRLQDQDFNNDHKDAGDMGDGHTVTALYEIKRVQGGAAGGRIDPLKYQRGRSLSDAAERGELMTVKVRYKDPEGDTSRLLSAVVHNDTRSLRQASDDFRFATAVASFGLSLRGSPTVASLSRATIAELARGALGADRHGLRQEFVELIARAPQQASLQVAR